MDFRERLQRESEMSRLDLTPLVDAVHDSLVTVARELRENTDHAMPDRVWDALSARACSYVRDVAAECRGG